MKKFQKFTGRTARRAKPPRQNGKREVRWTIEKVGEEFIADSGTGIRVYADDKAKLMDWIWAVR